MHVASAFLCVLRYGGGCCSHGFCLPNRTFMWFFSASSLLLWPSLFRNECSVFFLHFQHFHASKIAHSRGAATLHVNWMDDIDIYSDVVVISTVKRTPSVMRNMLNPENANKKKRTRLIWSRQKKSHELRSRTNWAEFGVFRWNQILLSMPKHNGLETPFDRIRWSEVRPLMIRFIDLILFK